MASAEAPKTVNITVRAGPETLKRLNAVKLARANVTGKWASNQSLFAEAMLLLIEKVEKETPAEIAAATPIPHPLP